MATSKILDVLQLFLYTGSFWLLLLEKGLCLEMQSEISPGTLLFSTVYKLKQLFLFNSNDTITLLNNMVNLTQHYT